jgi:hypothetical protein
MDNNNNQDIKSILEDAQKIVNNMESCIKEDKAMNKEIEFLINEYKTNKRYFREEPGKVTIEDVIRTSVQLGWASKRNYDANPEIY